MSSALLYQNNSIRRGAVLATIFWVTATTTVGAAASALPAVIPNPAVVAPLPGEFTLSATTPIVFPTGDQAARRAAVYLRDILWRTHGLTLNISSGNARNAAINFTRDRRASERSGSEAYRLEATADRITLTANSASGLLYSGISLWQLLPVGNGALPATIGIPGTQIDDAPRFAWRGLMLDSARHFQSPEFIRQYIDWMALHKLNVLHWHLTDDQAWRLEIRKYPRLTQVAAWRVPAGPAAQADRDPATGKPRLYGGYYTQQTVREIVRYAAERGISIVPEIEMPGHASATLAAYPALAAGAHPSPVVPADWGIYPNVYNIEESTFVFLENVLREVMALFPGKYIHIGGDEVEKQQWKESARVQQRMRGLGVKEIGGVQTYFTQRIGRFLKKNGRRLIGWDEILEPGLLATSVVMSWRGIDGALAAAQKNFDTILSPWPTLYFDNRQGDAADEPPGRGKVISLEDVYRFEPMPEKLTGTQRKHVLGLQGNIWTEHIRTEDRVAAMTFPRAAAIAELGWSAPDRRAWPDFVRRMGAQMARYQAIKLPFSDSAFAVRADVRQTGAVATVALSTQVGVGEIHYSLDSRDPTAQSPHYQAPVRIPMPAELRVASFAGDLPLSRVRSVALRRELAQRRASQELKLCSENIALSLEDDAPLREPRAVFLMDIQNPCWIFPQANLDEVASVTAGVGQVPFNFQIGELVKKIQFAKPMTPEGELEIHLDDCNGEVIARLPLVTAITSNAVTTLPTAVVTARTGKHDLCLRFAQNFADWTRDPVWALDWIQLNLADEKP